LFVSAVAEGASHFIFSRFVTNRRLDHALVDCHDARGYHSRGDIYRILSAGLPALASGYLIRSSDSSAMVGSL
jgi:hypothetical protein